MNLITSMDVAAQTLLIFLNFQILDSPEDKRNKFYILKKDGGAMQSVIYIGNKAPVKYATAVATEFNKGADEVLIKARGRAISTAVDACQISMNKFLEGIEIKDIKIFTEEIENRNVSAIEILLGRI